MWGTRIRKLLPAALLLAGLTIALAACKVSTSEREDGEKKNKNVSIETPIGSLKVREGEAKAEDVGVAIYPGARQVSDKEDDDSANVSFSSGLFGLKVIAVKYETDDAPEKVFDFYRGELKKYGTVVECKPDRQPEQFWKKEKDSEELHCDDGDVRNRHMTLKVGVDKRQRVIAVEPRGGKTRFALVYVSTRGGDDTI